VIAARANNHEGIVGIAPEAELIALKACWETTPGRDRAECNSFTLAKALAAALALHADVVNLSLVGPDDGLLTLLVKQGLREGIVFVGAVAPGDGGGEVAGFPAGIEGVLAVDRAERSLPANGTLRAPGEDILTLTAGGRYDFVSGSSVAAAQVTGVVALLLSRERGLTPERIRGLLSPPALSPAATSAATRSINACDAMAGLLRQPRCNSNGAAPDIIGSR
jgi:subtilisin family serine protease